MIGAMLGDIIGSVYEFDNIKTKEFELFRSDCEFTDDTVMTVAVADALMQYEDVRQGDSLADIDRFKSILVETMHKYGKLYPEAGYGGHFGLWLDLGETEPYNSFGNGSAMRVSPVAWYAKTLEETLAFATASAEVTHNHPEGIKGAVATAGAVFLAKNGATKDEVYDFVSDYYNVNFSLDAIRPFYGFYETCQDSVPQAIVAFLESENFEDAIRNAISIGGDSDTIAAIAGSIAEAFYGIPAEISSIGLKYLDNNLAKTIRAFKEKVCR